MANSDVSEEGEEALRERVAEYQQMLGSLRDYVWCARVAADGSLKHQYYSPVVERITGRPASFFEAGIDRWISTIHESDLPGVMAATKRLLAGATSEEDEEYRVRLPDGGVRWVRDRVRATAGREPGTRILTGVVSDATDSRRMGEHLQEAQKLEVLGVLAGGIAHDFNNILVGVLGGAELVSQMLPADHATRPHLRAIETSALRAAELCQQMLAYAGKATVAMGPVDLSDLVQSMEELLRASANKDVQLQLHLNRELPAVMVDTPQLRQLVLNLITNASDALGQVGGNVVLTTLSQQRESMDFEGCVVGRGNPPGEYVSLIVEDTGCGMDAQTLQHMFDPFYSTKESGHGLGLSAALGIVRAHDGALQVTSSAGNGTRIDAHFPATARDADSLEIPLDEVEPVKGQGCVLVIDDEETVLLIAGAVLEAQGYCVLTAADGADGLEVFRKRGKEIAAVVLDMTMPGLSGNQVFMGLRKLDPQVPVLLSSGYSKEDAVAQLTDEAATGFLHKPYRARELQAAVSSIAREI